jgi:hypothetical protein
MQGQIWRVIQMTVTITRFLLKRRPLYLWQVNTLQY